MDDNQEREADKVLRIWADYKRQERGTVTQGYPKRSAGIETGGSCGDETFDLMVQAADARMAVVADTIMDDLKLTDPRYPLALWNRYLVDVWNFRGDRSQILDEAMAAFYLRGRKRGICV